MSNVKKINRLIYYINGFSRALFPVKSFDKKIDELYKKISKEHQKEIEIRVDYYNKIKEPITAQNGTTIRDLLTPKKPKAYYFDLYEFARYFPQTSSLDYAFGDVSTILNSPMITKSRPIHGDNENNILLNLDKVRHFISVEDDLQFSEKMDLMIGRGAIHQEHRLKFYERYFDSPICDLGQTNTDSNPQWVKPKISIPEHLKYKFILSLEGNDVATNLKWIMSSNSVAVSPPLKMETWYMEGILQPDVHFVGIDENYGNLEEKLNYYIEHPNEMKDIIKNANKHRSQFNNRNVESLISLLVLKKYFNSIS